MQRIQTVVLLAGGKGERAKQIMPGFPKCLIELVDGITVLDMIITDLWAMNIREFIFAAGRNTNKISKYLNEKWPFLKSYFLSEPKEGTCNVIKFNIDKLPNQFLIANADTIYIEDPGIITILPKTELLSSANIGIGRSFLPKGGNFLINKEGVYTYDKAGLPSYLSDTGYHIIRKDKHLINTLHHNHGMLEDGFFQNLLSKPQPLLHKPLNYLDLGTEHAIAIARKILSYVEYDHDEFYSFQYKSRCLLEILRNKLTDDITL